MDDPVRNVRLFSSPHAVWAAEKSDVTGRIVYPGFVPVVRTCSLLYLAQAFMPGFVAFLVRDPDFAAGRRYVWRCS